MAHESRWRRALPLAMTVFAAAACDNATGGFEHVQRAVGRGAQAALAARPAAVDDEARAAPANVDATRDALPVERVPAPALDAEGRARFTPDANHRDIDSARTPGGYAVVWTDGARSAVYVGHLDARGRARGDGVRLHAAASEEEGVASPAVVAAGEGLGVAWADRENGRVRFARVDSRGAPRGRVAIVHDGVTAPHTTRLSWNGRDFGVAVALRHGVYFARVAPDGSRVGDASLLAEESSVSSLDGVEWDGRAFSVSFTVQNDGRLEQVRQRVGARRAETASLACRPSA